MLTLLYMRSPRMLQVEYLKKLLKGDFSIRHRISFNALHGAPLLNKFQEYSGRQIREGLRFKKPKIRVSSPVDFLEFPPLRDFCTFQRKYCPGCTDAYCVFKDCTKCEKIP